MSTAIIHKKCKTAEQLMAALGTSNPLWGGLRRMWVFRGHEDDGYKLVPGALRSSALLGYSSQPKIGIQSCNEDQFYAEFRRLHEFYWSVDAQGLHVAGNSDCLRTPSGWDKMWEEVRATGWPIDSLLPLLALAQHYGVSTRLLDWSEKPFVAAHFASKGAIKKQTSFLGLWALNMDWIINVAFPGSAKKIAVYVVTAPRAPNGLEWHENRSLTGGDHM